MKNAFARRLLAAILALTMVFSLCGTALAAETGNSFPKAEVNAKVEQVLKDLYAILEANDPDMMDQIWAYAEKEGYIEAIQGAVETLKELSHEEVKAYLEKAIPAIEDSLEALKSEAETLVEDLTALKAELEAKLAAMEAELAAAEEAAKTAIELAIAETKAAIAAVETTIEEAAAAVKAIDAAILELHAVLVDLINSADQLVESVVALEDAVVDLVETMTSNVVMTVEQTIAAVESVMAAVESAVALLETAYNQINELVVVVDTAIADATALLDNAFVNAHNVVTELAATLSERPAELAALLQAETEKGIAILREAYAPELAQLEAQLAEIDQHIAEKKAELEAEYAPQIAELKEYLAQKEAELAELLAKVDAEIAKQVAALEEQYGPEIAALKAELEALYADVTGAADIEEKIAALEAHIAEKEAELAAAIEAVKAEIAAAYAEAVKLAEEAVAAAAAHVEQKVAELEAALAEVPALYAAAKAEIVAKCEAINAEIDAEIAALGTVASDGAALIKVHVDAVRAVIVTSASGLDAVLTSGVANADEAVAAIGALANAIVNEVYTQIDVIKNAWVDAYIDATTNGFVREEDSYYVAVGDYSAESKSYVDLVANHADMNIPYTNLAKNGLTAAGVAASVQGYAAEIAKADLITIGFGAKSFLEYAVEQAKEAATNNAAQMDWVALVGAEAAAVIESLLADLTAELNTAIPMAVIANAVATAVESYAYSYVTYVAAYAPAVHAIHAINPEALVILVGMHNPLEDMVVTMDDGTAIAVGEYLGYLVDLVNAYSLGYAMIFGNTIYVDAPNVEVANPYTNVTVGEFASMLLFAENGLDAFNPTAAGQQYVADQILDALTVHTHNYIYGKCACGKLNPNTTMFRIFGETRIETAFSIANELKLVKGISKYDTILVAAARNYPDALAGSYMAIQMDAPILLVENNAASVAKVTEYIGQNLNAGGKVYILGGEAAVTTEMDAALTTAGIASERVAGANRVETNLAILNKTGYNATQKVLICNARNYADSLAASATGLPIVLVEKTLTDAQKAFLATTSKDFVIAGGNLAVSEEIEAELKAIGTVTRLAGADRMETSVMVAGLVSNPRTAVMAYSHDFPDGLCGGPLAYAVDGVLLLTNDGNYATTDSYVDGGHNTGLILGGTDRIADATARDIFDIADLAITPREAK